MFTIRKEFNCSCGHQLSGLPEEHPCTKLHGHNYLITVELKSATLNEVGFVVDYRELQPIKVYIDTVMDHRHLNDIWEFNPTAENIAKHLFFMFRDQFPDISAVEVSETPKTTARFELNGKG